MIITCPHCQTKYQVTHAAIGSAGRKVQCAHCQQAWQQTPLTPTPLEPPPHEPDPMFDAMAEDNLDEALAAEEHAAAQEKAALIMAEDTEKTTSSGKVDPRVIRQRQKDFTRRQSAILSKLPLARLRRAARVLGVLFVCTTAALFYFARVEIVDRFPGMAGVYEAMGLGVNVVGLDFANVTTLHTLREGKEVLVVSAQIVGLQSAPVAVPPVVISLINGAGDEIYQWSVTPPIRDLMAGERDSFETRLTLPPGDAARVKLSFAAAGARLAVQSAPAASDHTISAAPALVKAGQPAEPHPPSSPTEHH